MGQVLLLLPFVVGLSMLTIIYLKFGRSHPEKGDIPSPDRRRPIKFGV